MVTITNIKAANEAEAEKYEEQLRNVQKKMQVFIINISIIIINTIFVIIVIIIYTIVVVIVIIQAMESAFDVCTEDLFNQVCSF